MPGGKAFGLTQASLLQTIEYGWFVLAGSSDVRVGRLDDYPRMNDPITDQAIEMHTSWLASYRPAMESKHDVE